MGTRATPAALGLARALSIAVGLLLCASCGKGGGATGGGRADDSGQAGDSGAGAADLPPLQPLPMGLAELSGFAYSSKGDARKRFGAVSAAEKRADWAHAAAACRELIERDPSHLEAHWHLASALARQGRFDAAVAPLSTAVAGDWMRWGERSLRARALRGFHPSPQGARYARLVEAYRDEFQRALGDALLVVGRRGRPWPARGTGATTVNHRSEIYAYVGDSKRFLRVSRTNGSLVGFVRSRAAKQLGFVSYRKVWVPDEKKAAGGAQPYIRQARIGVIDLDRARMSLREVTFDDVRWIELFYADQGKNKPRLLVRVRPVEPARGERLVQTFAIDAEAGRAKEIKPVSQGPDVLRVGHDSVEMMRPSVEGVTADWGRDGSAGAFRIDRTRKTITLPAGESAGRNSMIWSPKASRIAFATAAVNPCSDEAKEREVALYVVEAATGKLRKIAQGEGAFAPVWLDDTRLAYVDKSAAEPGVRLVEVTSGEKLANLQSSGGLGTDWLPARSLCSVQGEEEEALGSPDEEVFVGEEEEAAEDSSDPGTRR